MSERNLIDSEREAFAFERWDEGAADEFVAENQPGEDWVVEKVFGVESVNMVVGDAGSKKTFSMMDLAMCAAMGVDWLGRKTLQTGVLWVDEESGTRRMRQRLSAAVAGHKGEDVGHEGEDVGHEGGEDLPFYFSSVAGYDLGNSRDISGLANRAQEYGCGLIVVDSLAGAMGSVDENSITQLGKMFRHLRWLSRETMAAVVLIHHVNKAGLYRGSSSFKGYVDVMMSVMSGAHTDLVLFDTVKGRDAERQRFAGKMFFEEDKVWMDEANAAEAAVWVLRGDDLSPAAMFVVDLLRRQGPTALSEVLNSADPGIEREQVRRVVYWLVEKGVIVRVNPGKQGAFAVYGLVGGGD